MDYYWHQRQQQFYYQPYQINNVVPIASVRDYGDYKTSNKKNNNAEAIKTFSHADNDAAIHPPDYYYYYYVVQDDEEVPIQPTKKAMYYNYDPVYYQHQPQYVNYGNSQFENQHFDIISNGVAPTSQYEIHRSYSVPDDEFIQSMNINSNYYDLHNDNNYYYNNNNNASNNNAPQPNQQAFNQQYLPSVQPVLFDTPYYANPYKNRTKSRAQENPPKLNLSADSLLDQQNNKYYQQPYVVYQDVFFNNAKASKTQQQMYQQKYQKVAPITKKEIIITATNATEPIKTSDTEKKTKAKENSSSSSCNNEDKKAAEPQKTDKNTRQTPINVDKRRINGPPVFIPPDTEKLTQPTLRGPPTGFLNKLAAPQVVTATTSQSSVPQSNIVDDDKTEVDRLREEVDVLEKQLSDLRKAFNSSKSSLGSKEDLSLEKENSIKDDDIKKNLEATSKKNVESSSDEDVNNSKKYSSVDSGSSSSSSSKSSDDEAIKKKNKIPAEQVNQQIPAQQPQKPQVKEVPFIYHHQQQQQHNKPVKTSRTPNPLTNANLYQQPYSTSRYDYYELDPQDQYKADYTRNNVPTRNMEYSGFNYRNEHIYPPQHHHHHYHVLNPHHQHQQYLPPQHHKYKYPANYNYSPKYNQYQEYTHPHPSPRIDQFNQVYNIHGAPLKKADGDKKNKLDKNNNKSQKFANNFVNQQDPKKIFGPSERALQAETRRKETVIESKINQQKPLSSKNVKPSKKQYNSDKGSVAGSIFDVPLPSDNVSEYSAFVNNVFSKALDK